MDNSSSAIEKQLLLVIDRFLSELGAERAKRGIALDAALEQDLGLGSLEKAELIYRIEKAFDIQLPITAIVEAKTVNDILLAVQNANPPEKPHQEVYAVLEQTQVNPAAAKTLMEVLVDYAQHEPNRPHIYLQDEAGKECVITYGQLFTSATEVARGLVASNLKAGETVAIMLPTSEEFFYAFFGVLFAGGVPVPIYPPFRPDQIEDYAKREALILHNAQVRILITFQKAEAVSKLLRNFIPSLKEITTVDLLKSTRGITAIIVD